MQKNVRGWTRFNPNAKILIFLLFRLFYYSYAIFIFGKSD